VVCRWFEVLKVN